MKETYTSLPSRGVWSTMLEAKIRYSNVIFRFTEGKAWSVKYEETEKQVFLISDADFPDIAIPVREVYGFDSLELAMAFFESADIACRDGLDRKHHERADATLMIA